MGLGATAKRPETEEKPGLQAWLAARARKRLADMRKKHEIPELPFSPTFDRVIAYRLDQHKEQKVGSIIVPDVHKQASPEFVLVAAGMQAMDYFVAHGIEIGDVVWLARFSGWEPEVLRLPGERAKSMIYVLAQDCVGSKDLLGRLESGEVEVVLTESGTHRLRYAAGYEQDIRSDLPPRSI